MAIIKLPRAFSDLEIGDATYIARSSTLPADMNGSGTTKCRLSALSRRRTTSSTVEWSSDGSVPKAMDRTRLIGRTRFECRSLTVAQGYSANIDDPVLVDGDLLKYEMTSLQVNEAGGQAYRDRHRISLPSFPRTWDSQGVLRAQTQFRYDENPFLGYGWTSNWEDPGNVRGNLTTTLRRIDTSEPLTKRR